MKRSQGWAPLLVGLQPHGCADYRRPASAFLAFSPANGTLKARRQLTARTGGETQDVATGEEAGAKPVELPVEPSDEVEEGAPTGDDGEALRVRPLA